MEANEWMGSDFMKKKKKYYLHKNEPKKNKWYEKK